MFTMFIIWRSGW